MLFKNINNSSCTLLGNSGGVQRDTTKSNIRDVDKKGLEFEAPIFFQLAALSRTLKCYT
jgi:hypothetical protein